MESSSPGRGTHNSSHTRSVSIIYARSMCMVREFNQYGLKLSDQYLLPSTNSHPCKIMGRSLQLGLWFFVGSGQLAATSPRSTTASVLYTNLSGEEILQQWISKHPEVAKKYQVVRQQTRDPRDEKKIGKSGQGLQPSAARQRSQQEDSSVVNQHELPPELQPYAGVLPPSLLPPALKLHFPGSTEVSEWGWVKFRI